MVTGANGFLGRHIIPLLINQGHDVHALSRDRHKSCGMEKWHQIDLFDDSQVEWLMSDVMPTHLLHLAWCTKPGSYWTSLENIAWLRSGCVMLTSFAKHGGTRLVVAGSCAEYSWEQGRCHEDVTPMKPNTFYGACKYAYHLVCDSFARTQQLSCAWGHLFHLYGPGEKKDRLIPYLITNLLSGNYAVCHNAGYERDFLYIEDAASAIVKLLFSCVTGSVNIASGEVAALGDIAEKIARKIGRMDLLQYEPEKINSLEPQRIEADVKRLRDEVYWQPHVNLNHGLDRTISWWQQQTNQLGIVKS